MGRLRHADHMTSVVLGLVLALATGAAAVQPPADGRTWLPTGATMTPAAVPGTVLLTLNPGLPGLPDYLADHAVAARLSPDGTTLLVLTSGFNRNYDERGQIIPRLSGDYVFVFDVRAGIPRQRQALVIPNAFVGLDFAPDGRHFFVSGGGDDTVTCFALHGERWSQEGPAIALNHPYGEGLARARAMAPPAAAGLAVTADGRRLLVSDFGNDAVTLVDWAAHRVLGELDLRPGRHDPRKAGARGGTFPYAVAIAGDVAYVASVRDRELVVIDLGTSLRILARIPLAGNPDALLLNRSGSALYVAEDNVDRIAVIDTTRRHLSREVQLHLGGRTTPARGLSPNALALSPDEHTLYATLGGINAVAVVRVMDGRVQGLIPTAWYPTGAAASRDGQNLYVTTAKSPAGANPGNCLELAGPALAGRCPPGRAREAGNAYVLQQSKGGLAMMPVPAAPALADLTRIVLDNNTPQVALDARDRRLYGMLRTRIHHLIYIIKENRTYDQVLGDLAVGNGDPGLTQFPRSITPNQHQLAEQFVDLDDFYASGEVSGTGWPWSVAARTTDIVEKTVPPRYAARGFSYDSEGTNRNVNVGLATLSARRAANPLTRDDPDVLAGAADVAAPDGPLDNEPEQGRLWNEALRRHQSVRNYGFFIDLQRYLPRQRTPGALPLLRDPAATGTVVAYPTDPALAARTDPYFRGFDNRFPDYYRYREWAREFAGYERSGSLPRLELVRLMHDHLGDFATALDGIDTPQTQVADNDYAVGLLVERVAHSRYARDTLIVIVEDDAQDGPDHVDAQRTVALLAGPYVRQGAVVSTRYATTDLLRTMELVLGLRPLNVHDAHAHPMSDVFDLDKSRWQFAAVVPAVLRATTLPVPPGAPMAAAELACGGSAHDAAYWARQTAGMDFSVEDRVDSARLNRVLWSGMQADKPFPLTRNGADLRADRPARLSAWASRCRH